MHQKNANGLSCPLASPGEWKSIHLDDLMPPENFQANLGQLSTMTIAEIFTSSSLLQLPTGKKLLATTPLSPCCCPFRNLLPRPPMSGWERGRIKQVPSCGSQEPLLLLRSL